MSKLKKITQEAKRIRKAHPNKYKSLTNAWSQGYIKEAARNVGRGKLTKPAKKKATPVTKKKAKVRKKAKPKKKQVTKTVAVVTRSVGKKVGGKKRHKKWGTVKQHRRRVSGKSNTGLILGIGALALGAVYLMSRDTSQQPTYQNLPPIQQTGNQLRNQQTNNVIQWAMAAGIALSAITSLIDRLNNSSDQQVDSIYKDVAATGDIGAWI